MLPSVITNFPQYLYKSLENIERTIKGGFEDGKRAGVKSNNSHGAAVAPREPSSGRDRNHAYHGPHLVFPTPINGPISFYRPSATFFAQRIGHATAQRNQQLSNEIFH